MTHEYQTIRVLELLLSIILVEHVYVFWAQYMTLDFNYFLRLSLLPFCSGLSPINRIPWARLLRLTRGLLILSRTMLVVRCIFHTASLSHIHCDFVWLKRYWVTLFVVSNERETTSSFAKAGWSFLLVILVHRSATNAAFLSMHAWIPWLYIRASSSVIFIIKLWTRWLVVVLFFCSGFTTEQGAFFPPTNIGRRNKLKRAVVLC